MRHMPSNVIDSAIKLELLHPIHGSILGQKALKGQLISKANFEIFIWTKNERKYFCISAIASKMGQTIKIFAHYHAN